MTDLLGRVLRTFEGELPKPTEHDSCSGVYRKVRVNLAVKESELLAQPETDLLAMHFSLGTGE